MLTLYEALELGYKFNLRRSPIKFSNDGLNYGLNGNCNDRNKTINVNVRGRMGRAEILWVCFHELRHAEHRVDKLFKNYYSKEMDEIIDFIQGMGPKPDIIEFDFDTGLEAENDCEDYAASRLKELGISVARRQIYPMENVLSYRLKVELEKRKEIKETRSFQEFMAEGLYNETYNSYIKRRPLVV